MTRRVRRYAVPGWMIERATERRLAGDWRGACAAAGVDVAFDLAGVANEHGSAFAAALADDLRHLAPDLVRWHAPRYGPDRGTLAPRRTVLLSRPGAGAAVPADAPVLALDTPRGAWDAPQRMTLRLRSRERSSGDDGLPSVYGYEASGPTPQIWTEARHLWDARRAGELRERLGGSALRAPFLNPDGTPRPAADLPSADPGRDDPAAFTEWVTQLEERGDAGAALAAAGVDLDRARPGSGRGWRPDPAASLSAAHVALDLLEAEARRLAAGGYGDRYWARLSSGTLLLDVSGRTSRLGVGVGLRGGDLGDAVRLPDAAWRRSCDLDLLRDGTLGIDDLHPLVRGALAPAAPAPTGPVGPPEPEPPAPVRVRCRGVWHEVVSADGELRVPHSRQEIEREAALRAFGGGSPGCFTVRERWTSGGGWLPKALRAQRLDLFERVLHGDTPGVLRLVELGVDPRIRDGARRTLLHHLSRLDHGVMLPLLLEKGLDLESEDRLRRTPLFAAAYEYGSPDLVRALLAAGARTEAIGLWDEDGGEQTSLADVLEARLRLGRGTEPEQEWTDLLEDG
ncbi:ankyrin repeat domain-containing protein [Nocardiopsis sp. FIRDI 009]|uniref:ankyrin repeat domain-containing protein n=1 Tax=Nocardiopsis sp. FIRDI 009 TaxID=714197 RepID=UPI001300B31B|nr:ankyrin repeat domain-containing protein [Nocardiopsis sp. FIRDI 009]